MNLTNTMRCAACAALLTLGAAAQARPDAGGPVVRLFPTTVLEDIRETGAVAEDMENSLADVIARMDLQEELYRESLCEGADGDAGCDRISRQLGATYQEMLNLMAESLPDMERSVARTRSSLETRLREEVGLRTTPTALQDSLLGVAQPAVASNQPALRGRSGVRLSDRFRAYYELVATGGGSASQSLTVVAADIYLDMEDAEFLIAATQQEIARASAFGQLNQELGFITPQMAQVVSGVKEILFGEVPGEGVVPAPPYSVGETEYQSPLAF